MELMTKQGYKQTELGLIPKDWGEPKSLNEVLSEMTDFVAAGSFESLRENVSVYDSDSYAFYVRLVDIRAGIGHLKQKFVDKISYDFLKRSNLFGDEILIANIGANVGEVFLMPKVNRPATIAPNMILMRTNESILNSQFCYYFIDSKTGQNLLSELIAGSGHPKLNKTDLKKLLIPIPPTLTEQKAIATALSDVDALITSLEQVITKKKAIKQGAMQQLLTPPHKGGKRLPGFEGEWVEKKLGDIGDCIRGVSYNGSSDLYPFDNNNSIRLLRSNNVYDKKIVFQNLQYVKKEKVNSHQIIQPKDILICMANGSKALVGKAGQFNGANMKYTFGAFMGILRPNIDECDGDFIFNLFSTNSFRCHLDIQLSGSSINNLKPSDIEDFKFYSPNYPEQQAIAQILSDMDAEITQLETKKEKYQAIKQGMMQELLTGKTRLI